MSRLSVLQEGKARRGATPRRPRGHRVLLVLLAIALGLTALLVFMASEAKGPPVALHLRAARPAKLRPAPPRDLYATQLAPPAERVSPPPFKAGLRSGLLFDVTTGRVLWEHNPGLTGPIASLTKMMTAMIVVAHAKPSDQALITSAATNFTGSGVGLLPLGKRVSVMALLYGMLLPSGNDAAIALAEDVAGSQPRFVAMMNREAAKLGLTCTHFSNVSGVLDQDNYSCTRDVAALAHTVLKNPLLGQIVGSRSAVLPFPIAGGKLYLYNNNPLLLARYPGANGVKTGYTTASGQCLVATARRGRAWLGVVLLHSGNAPAQAQWLLSAGFTKLRAR